MTKPVGYLRDVLPLATRFWLKVYQRGDCWEWRGPISVHGYGVFNDTSNNLYAHRMAYEMAKGTIPANMEIDHLCRHRWCVRPSHLEAVSHSENLLRGVSPSAHFAGRDSCKHGHPFDEMNTYLPTRGGRSCRACARIRDAARYARKVGRPVRGRG